MAQSEIERIRALLSSKPRPVGWLERRKRLDDVGSVWPVAEDVALTAADVNGVPGEWSIAPGSDRRSEEHTSELQSQSNLVCRLLLEKNKRTALRATLSSPVHRTMVPVSGAATGNGTAKLICIHTSHRTN